MRARSVVIEGLRDVHGCLLVDLQRKLLDGFLYVTLGHPRI